METTILWLEESKTDDMRNSSEICRKKCWRTLRCLLGFAKHCSQALDKKSSQWQVMCMAAGFGLCHTSGKSQKWLSANFYNYTSPNVWPPNSLDLNPWIIMYEKDTNRRASTTKAQLIDRIKVVFESLPRETVTSACSRFWSRIETVNEAVNDANIGYFELNLLLTVV